MALLVRAVSAPRDERLFVERLGKWHRHPSGGMQEYFLRCDFNTAPIGTKFERWIPTNVFHGCSKLALFLGKTPLSRDAPIIYACT